MSTEQPSKFRKASNNDVKIYLRNVSRRWKREVEGSQNVLVLSPYLTSTAAEKILETTPGERCEVYTVFKAENFASGASSIQTLFKLHRHGCKLYDLPNLHAKIILVPGVFASIGSQNLTSRGRSNKEATSVFTDPETVAAIQKKLKPWLEERRQITLDMLDDLNMAIKPILALMRKARQACEALDQTIVEAEATRNEDRLLDEDLEWLEEYCQDIQKEEDERHRRLQEKSTRIIDKIESFYDGHSVSEEVARDFIEHSAWWLTHHRRPVRARGYRDRLIGDSGDWKVDFGANTFHVSYAIGRCATTLKLWLDRKEAGEEVSIDQLKNELIDDIAGSVSSFSGRMYDYYNIDGYDMKFGSISIDVKDFMAHLLKITGTLEQFPD